MNAKMIDYCSEGEREALGAKEEGIGGKGTIRLVVLPGISFHTPTFTIIVLHLHAYNETERI